MRIFGRPMESGPRILDLRPPAGVASLLRRAVACDIERVEWILHSGMMLPKSLTGKCVGRISDGSSREPRGSSTTVRSSGQPIAKGAKVLVGRNFQHARAVEGGDAPEGLSERREGARRKKFSARTSSGRPRCSRRAGAKRMPLQHLATVTEDYFTKVMVTTRPSRYTFPSFPRSNTNVVGFSVFGSS